LAIKGSLVEASLPEVIQLLAYSLKSGCLSVTDGRNLGNIFLKEGKIIYATILRRKVRLGDSMLEKQLVQQDILKRALAMQKEKKGKRLGEILVDMGAISQAVLEKELQQQIEEAIHTMLTWENGYFNFEVDLLPSSAEQTILLSSQDLLLGGARLVQDWQKIEERLPPPEAVLVARENMQDFDLTSTEQEILSLVDGVNTVDEVIKESGFEYHDVCKAIYVLLVAGVIEKPKQPLEKVRGPGNIDEYKTAGFAFYQRGQYGDAESEFKKILNSAPDHAEALFYMGLVEIARRNDDRAKDYMEKALAQDRRVSTLVDIGYVCNRMQLYDESVEYLGQARTQEPNNSKVLLNLGIANYHRGALPQSAQDFDRCLALSDAVVTPHLYRAAISVDNNDIPKAIELLTEAIEKFPRFPAFKNNLALLYARVGRNEDAENLYLQALALDPDDRTVLRNLADLYYRMGMYGAARECYEQIPENERDVPVFLNLGRLYLLTGDKKRAVDQWKHALSLNPGDERLGRDIEILSGSF
jgi:tetratricopeptide (TPR) repeat protein